MKTRDDRPVESADHVGILLARLRRKAGLSREELAELCAEEFGGEIDKARSYIRRVESGRKKLIKPEDRKRVKAILKHLGATLDEVLQVINNLNLDEIGELDLFCDPASISSRMDQIIILTMQLKQLLRRYGIYPQDTMTPPDMCSTTLDLKSELSNLKRSCEQADARQSEMVQMIQAFKSTRIPISDLIADELKGKARDKKALIETINGYLAGIEKATENVARVGAGYLNRLTRIDEIALMDYSTAWLSILEQFHSEKRKPFPVLKILEGRGRILSWEDAHQWENAARTHGWEFDVVPLDRQHIDSYFTQIGRNERRIVVAVGVEAVAIDGSALAYQGIRLICEKAKEQPSATVAVAAQTFKVREFKVGNYLWGTDQYRQPFTLDILSPHSYSVIITDDRSHWSQETKRLACCIEKWQSYFRNERSKRAR